MPVAPIRFLRRLVLLALLGVSAPLAAFSFGSTVCEVNALPFAPMAGVLRQPAPAGWTLRSDADSWHPGALRRFRLEHPDPQRRARGVLIWVRGNLGSPIGAGSFVELGASDLYQYVGIDSQNGENCQQWSLTHRSAAPKSQAQMLFAWRAPMAGGLGFLIVRAFVIEDCDTQPGGCRDAQALTDFLPLREVLFAEGFE